MEKTTTLNLRVNPSVKYDAEVVLKQLGIPLSTAIDMYLRQISLVGGIPFAVLLPKASVPASVDADGMTAAELREAILIGAEEAKSGGVVSAKHAFEEFREKHK